MRSRIRVKEITSAIALIDYPSRNRNNRIPGLFQAEYVYPRLCRPISHMRVSSVGRMSIDYSDRHLDRSCSTSRCTTCIHRRRPFVSRACIECSTVGTTMGLTYFGGSLRSSTDRTVHLVRLTAHTRNCGERYASASKNQTPSTTEVAWIGLLCGNPVRTVSVGPIEIYRRVRFGCRHILEHEYDEYAFARRLSESISWQLMAGENIQRT